MYEVKMLKNYFQFIIDEHSSRRQFMDIRFGSRKKILFHLP